MENALCGIFGEWLPNITTALALRFISDLLDFEFLVSITRLRVRFK